MIKPTDAARHLQLDLVFDAEAAASRVLHETKCADECDPCSVKVARTLGVPVFYETPAVLKSANAICMMRDGRPHIWVRSGLPTPIEQFKVAHELGHAVTRLWSIRPTDAERWCDYFAGALLLPRAPLERAWYETRDVRQVLKRWAHVPQTATVLRLGEIGVTDVWVTQESEVRYERVRRGPEASVLPLAASALRRGVAVARRPGLAAARLGEVPGRAAVVRVA